MEQKSAFDLIHEGNFEEALEVAVNYYEKTGGMAGNVITALLLLKDYEKAFKYCINIIEKNYVSSKSDSDYMICGVCSWLMGNKYFSVVLWKYALDKTIRYTSNIVIPPALLYFAAVYLKDTVLEKEAIKELQKHWKKEIPLAGYLLGEISEESLLSSLSDNPILREREHCKYEFYIAARHLKNSNFDDYKEHLQRCFSLKGRYLEFEYFLALGELESQEVK